MISFIYDKTILTIIFLYENENVYVTDIMKNCDTTFAHAGRIVQNLELEKLVKCIIKGRTKYIKLTQKGQNVAEHLKKAVEGVVV